MHSKSLLLLLASLIFSTPSFAAKKKAENWGPVLGTYNSGLVAASMRLAAIGNQQKVTSNQCDNFYANLYDGNQLTMNIAFGYFDVSSGEDFVSFNRNYGQDLVLDSIAYVSLMDRLKSPCTKGSSACGFKKASGSDGRLVKKIKTRTRGTVTVVLNITHASYSASNTQNISTYAQQQTSQTRSSESNFFGGIQNGTDVAIYMGHARSGGGPDFAPPRLLSNGHPDYGYYKSRRAGIGTLSSALRNSQSKPKVIGLLACKSTQLFRSTVQNASPNSLIVSAASLFDDVDIFPTGLAMIDNLMAERCGSQFTQGIKISPAASKSVTSNFAP